MLWHDAVNVWSLDCVAYVFEYMYMHVLYMIYPVSARSMQDFCVLSYAVICGGDSLESPNRMELENDIGTGLKTFKVYFMHAPDMK